MTAVLEANIQFLSRSDVAEVVIDKAPTNQLFRVLPFVPIDGHELRLAGIDASNSLSFLATIETEGSTLNAAAPVLASRTYSLSRIAGILEINTITQDKYSEKNNVLQTLVDLKARGVRDRFCELLYAGDATTSGEFDGLQVLARDYGQMLTADNGSGGTVRPGELELLRSMVQVDQPTAEIYFVMHAIAYKHLLTVSYSDIEFVMHPVLGSIPALAGVPILIDNFIATDEGVGTDETTIYCVALGRGVGISGITPSGTGGQEIRVRGPITSATEGKMTYHVSWDVGIAAWNKGGVASLEKVKHGNVT